MNSTRLTGIILLLVGVALWLTPFYGSERAMWHLVVGVVAAIAGATLLLRGREVSA